ncbi:hypothetical protein [Streptomyces sp. NBC_01006]|uniref:hypothetical protein n=1 Tax=Streptomyces sp. NBC_01006 TaxID=2903716 RepID=UPI00386CAE9C
MAAGTCRGADGGVGDDMQKWAGNPWAALVTVSLGFFSTLAGAASGVNNTIRQIGSVIGAASVGALLQGRLAAELAAGKAYADAFVATLHVTAALPIAALGIAVLLCLLVRNHTKKPAPEPEPVRTATTPGAGATQAADTSAA